MNQYRDIDSEKPTSSHDHSDEVIGASSDGSEDSNNFNDPYRERVRQLELQIESAGKNHIKQSILLRARFFYLFFLLMALSAISMIIYYQFGSDSGKLKAQSIEYSFKSEVIEATRGDVLSQDKRTLATSIVYYDLRMDMMAQGLTDAVFNKNAVELSKKLSSFFKDQSASQYYIGLQRARSEKKRYYRLSPRRVDYLELQHIKTFPILNLPPNEGGFIAVEMGKRVNPYGNLAGRTIGFVNSVGVKVGLEGSFDNYLKGVNGLTVKQKISGNFWIPIVDDHNIDPINGSDIVTTINIDMQGRVQESLRRQVSEMEADWGCVVVMEVATGQIRAISNITRLKSGELIEDYNYAIGMSLEPGSTFKIAGLITLLDDAKASPDEQFNTGKGEEQIGYVKVIDTKAGGYGTLTLREIIEKSSNIGIAKAVNKYYGHRPARFVESLGKYGFNKPLGIEISGESTPLIKHPNLKNGWDGTTLTMMSYGYALRLSPIQTLAFFNAIANNGVLVRPQLVTAIESHGKTIKTFPTEVLNPAICSKETANKVKSILHGVTEDGTAKLIRNDKYTVAAKTGTAQIALGRHGYKTASGSIHYMGSIAGFFPVDKPKYSIVVAIKTFWDTGSDKVYYGGRLTGPLFKDIADYIFNSDLSMSKGGRNEVQTQVAKHDLTYFIDDPKRLNNIAKTLKVSIPISKPKTKIDSTGIPNVIGFSPTLAQEILWRTGVQVRLDGRGRIYEQKLVSDTITGIKTVYLKLK